MEEYCSLLTFNDAEVILLLVMGTEVTTISNGAVCPGPRSLGSV
jgi:hypothetical protein